MVNRLQTRWRGNLTVPKHAAPMVRRFIGICNEQDTTLTEISARSSLRRSTMSAWRYNRKPLADNLDAALRVLGYELWPRKIRSKR